MLLTYTGLTPKTISELSYFGVLDLIKYITGTTKYAPRRSNFMEQQIDPQTMKEMFKS